LLPSPFRRGAGGEVLKIFLKKAYNLPHFAPLSFQERGWGVRSKKYEPSK